MIATAITAGVLFLVGVLLYVFFAQQLGSATSQLAAKAKAVDECEQKSNRLVESQQALAQTKLELGCLETSITNYEYVPTLLKQLESLGKSMNLNVLSVRPQPIEKEVAVKPAASSSAEGGEKKTADASGTDNNAASVKKVTPKPYTELKIDIEVEGSYWNARNFMYRLTKFPKIIAVNQIQLSPSGLVMGRNSPKLQVKLNVTAFIFKEGDVAVGQPKTLPSTSAARIEGRSTNEG